MTSQPPRLVPSLERLVRPASFAPLSDESLLTSFIEDNNEDAFAELVARHGPMVFGVCCRVLHDVHDAEDVAQATFLLLAAKGRSIRRSKALPAWLHQTAHHLAVNFLRNENRRKQREIRTFQPASGREQRDPLDELTVRELLTIFDEELQRLRDKYRLPLILCALEGHTQQEAAKQLGWTQHAVKGRLERGRAQLRRSLVRRGLTLAASGAALEALDGMLKAGDLPANFAASTLSAWSNFGAKTAIISATTSSKALVLARESLRHMTWLKLKITLTLVLAIGGTTLGVGAFIAQGLNLPTQEAKQTTEPGIGQKTLTLPRLPGQQAGGVDRFGDPLPEGALSRLGTLRWRAPGEVQTFAVSPDGRTMAVAYQDGLCLIDSASGKFLRELDNVKTTGIERIAFSPDGSRVACSGEALIPIRPGGPPVKFTPRVQIWNLRGALNTRQIDLAKKLEWFGWTAEGQPIGFMLRKGEVVLRELETEKEQSFAMESLPPPNFGLSAIAYSTSAKILALAGRDRTIHVWDVATGRKMQTLSAELDYLRSLAVSDDGRTLASFSRHDGPPVTDSVQLWDLQSAKMIHKAAQDQRILLSVAFSPNSKTLATIGWRGIRFWDVSSGRESNRTKGIESFGKAISYSADGKTLVTMENYSPAIHVWNTDNEALEQKGGSHTSSPEVMAFSPDGARVATGATTDVLEGNIIVWDMLTGTSLLQVPNRKQIPSCAFTKDGRFLYSRWLNDKWRSFDAASGLEVQSLNLDDAERQRDAKQSDLSIFFSDDRKALVALSRIDTASSNQNVKMNCLVRGWDSTTGSLLFRRRRAFTDFGRAVSPDLKLLAVSQPERDPRVAKMAEGPGRAPILIEELATGRRVLNLPELEGQAQPLAFSPDGRFLATNNSGANGKSYTMRLWELTTAGEVLALPTTLNSRIAFSSDMQLLAVTSTAREIQLWDMRMGREIWRIKGLEADVESLAFSPDGRRLVSGFADSTLLVWDVSAKQQTAHAETLDSDGAVRAWNELASTDARKAFAARCNLAASPSRAMPMIKERLKPAGPGNAQKVQQLIVELKSDQRAVREAARVELEKLGDSARGELQKALAEETSAEAQRRIDALLSKLDGTVQQPELLQSLRAVAVLEDIATPEARKFLEGIAKGDPKASLTQQAKATFERLARRSPAKP